jgi:hypothetical protein
MPPVFVLHYFLHSRSRHVRCLAGAPVQLQAPGPDNGRVLRRRHALPPVGGDADHQPRDPARRGSARLWEMPRQLCSSMWCGEYRYATPKATHHAMAH